METGIFMVLTLEQLCCKVVSSVHLHLSKLERDMLIRGIAEPLLITGPNENGIYNIVDGNRRYKIMLKHPSLFESIPCYCYGSLVSLEEINQLRMSLKYTERKMTTLETVRLVEQSENQDELIEGLSKQMQKKVIRALEIPCVWRDLVDEKGKSQDALAVIWHDLKVEVTYKNQLLERLINTNQIQTEHADALKRAVKHDEFKILTQEQKQIVVESIISKAKFSDSACEMTIIQSIMQTIPDPTIADFWVNFCSFELRHLSSKLSKEMGSMIRKSTLQNLISARDEIAETIDDMVRKNRDFADIKHNYDQEIRGDKGKEKLSLLQVVRQSDVEVVKSSHRIPPRIEKTISGFRVIM